MIKTSESRNKPHSIYSVLPIKSKFQRKLTYTRKSHLGK